MNKKRILAIIGIILLLASFGLTVLIDYVLLTRTYGEYFNRGYGSGDDFDFDAYYKISAEVEANTVIDELSFAIFVCGFGLYPIFHYIMSLLEGIRTKNKKTIIPTIIGSVLAVCGLITILSINLQSYSEGDWTWRDYFFTYSFLHLPYYLAFAIIMLVRSFRKGDAKVDGSRLDGAAVPETTGKIDGCQPV